MAGQAGRLIAALALAGTAGAAAPDAARQLAGRYDREFPNAMASGERYTGRDVIEIVPVAPRAAYLRFHLDFANGHICSLWGVARAEGDALVYRGKPEGGRAGCTLHLSRQGGTLAWSDPANSCQSSCGARGSFVSGAVPFASRRPITYLPTLRASRQYRAALAEWRTGR